MTTRMRLRRADGIVYLERWGIECDLFGVYVHRMDGPDPGLDLHDHPWPFLSLVLRGGYVEERANTRQACGLAEAGERLTRLHSERFHWEPDYHRGARQTRSLFSWRLMRLDECHRITHLLNSDRSTWTLVFRGRRVRRWGFYLPDGWMDWKEYDDTRRRGDLYAEFGHEERP